VPRPTQTTKEISTLEGWKAGRLEGWKAGRLEGWKAGRLEGWEAGRPEGWKKVPYIFVLVLKDHLSVEEIHFRRNSLVF
jgi:hypothetical protein